MGASDAILYYIFHVVYLGHSTQILHRLWLASEGGTEDAWRALDESLKESHRATGIMSTLIATAAAALIGFQPSTNHALIRTFLLSSLTCSLISASYSVTLLSRASYSNPGYLQNMWKHSGVMFVILLSGPLAWLSHALWTFQAALLALVWLSEGSAAKVILTTLIGTRLVLGFWQDAHVRGFKDAIFGRLIGRRDGLDHRFINPTESAAALRMEHSEHQHWDSAAATPAYKAPFVRQESKARLLTPLASAPGPRPSLRLSDPDPKLPSSAPYQEPRPPSVSGSEPPPSIPPTPTYVAQGEVLFGPLPWEHLSIQDARDAINQMMGGEIIISNELNTRPTKHPLYFYLKLPNAEDIAEKWNTTRPEKYRSVHARARS